MYDECLVAEKYAPICALVAQRLGMQLRQLDVDKLATFIAGRLSKLRCTQTDYLERLQRDSTTNHGEWQHVAQCVTNNESFFFRDEGLYALLNTKLLPELLTKNRVHKRLRIWSAASSRGEEIYSLAILLKEMTEVTDEWSVQLYGSDINEKVLATARTGIYGDWSLRAISNERRERYFKRTNAGWQLCPEIRDMVDFKHLNLADDNYPQGRSWLHDIDLIICRNVFIYFAPDAIKTTVQKLRSCLAQDGILLTGHAELDNETAAGLCREVMPGSLVYRKAAAGRVEPVMLVQIELPKAKQRIAEPTTIRMPCMAHSRPSSNKYQAVERRPAKPLPKRVQLSSVELALDMFKACRYQEVLKIATTTKPRDRLEALNLLKLETQSWTNLGNYQAGLDAAVKALELDPFSAELFYLKAYIYELLGDIKAAAGALEKAIYLDGEFIPAYVELASLLDMSKRTQRANRLRRTATSLLSEQPQDADVFPYVGVCAGELKSLLSEMIGRE